LANFILATGKIMELKNQNVVSLDYELFVNGKLIEKTDTNHPFIFITGSGNVLPKFEENVLRSPVNGHFEFQLSAEEAYGPVRSEAIVDLPMNIFEMDGQTTEDLLVIGKRIPMQDSNGNHLIGEVVNVGKESVRMDFNHPLAGNNLHFKGKVLDIRQATHEEVLHGHIHGNHSCDGCVDPDCHGNTSC
jgi:FKBP-type peptidyl-prolyl cis-trans isomerase SlyD